MLDSEGAANRGYGGLRSWMRDAETIWRDNAVNARMTLIGRWNYHNELAAQLPAPGIRVVYAKAGTLPASCILRNSRTVIDHKLYWTTPRDEMEATFLIAILNSETARARTAHYQSRGQWGARDFDKVMFNLPIPRFDPEQELHRDLSATAEVAERVAAQVTLPENIRFQRARSLIRTVLADTGIAASIDALVARLLDGN